MEGQFNRGSLNFSHIFEKNINEQHDHFTKIFSISKFNLPFPRTKDRAIHVCPNSKPVYI